jgi:quercetin dioxygenase-like cupin family protein
MRRTAIVAAIVVATVVLPMTVASATPPTGDISYKDYARAQTQESLAVPINKDTSLVTGSYSIAPGGETGWRRLPGTMVLAVIKGKLTLRSAEGCTAKDYGAGQAAPVPGGTYRVSNSGNDTLEFHGVFFDQAAGAPEPLAEGAPAPAPANCSDISGLSAAATGVSRSIPAAGRFVELYSHNAVLNIPAGRDMFATYYDFGPGSSSGWLSHLPAVNIVLSGTLEYYEGRDGQCVKTETYHPGMAFFHPAHRHLAVNEGSEHMTLTTVYFDLPHETTVAPAVGNQTTAVDFTQLPPEECRSKLR